MISCKIISLEKLKEYPNTRSIILPVENGEVEILPGHSESFFLIKGDNNKKIVITNRQGRKENILAKDGIFYIRDDDALIVF